MTDYAALLQADRGQTCPRDPHRPSRRMGGLARRPAAPEPRRDCRASADREAGRPRDPAWRRGGRLVGAARLPRAGQLALALRIHERVPADRQLSPCERGARRGRARLAARSVPLRPLPQGHRGRRACAPHAGRGRHRRDRPAGGGDGAGARPGQHPRQRPRPRRAGGGGGGAGQAARRDRHGDPRRLAGAGLSDDPHRRPRRD
jgi:hypothetical protein